MVALAAYLGWDWYQARRAWDDAQTALARYDLAAAATHLDRYLQLRPDDPAGWFLAARTARRREEFTRAERYLAGCERTGGDPEAIRLERNLALVQRGQLGEIDDYLRATIGPDHPDAAIVLEALARGYLERSRWADAGQACAMLQRLQPEHPWAWLWRGWIAEKVETHEYAYSLYQRAFELAPDDPNIRSSLGRSLLRLRRPAEAEEHFRWLADRYPDDPDARVGLAESLFDRGRLDGAAAILDAVLVNHPRVISGAYLRGKVALQQQQPALAERWLRQATEVQPGDPEPLYLLVQSLQMQKKDREASELSRELEQLKKDLARLEELYPKLRPSEPQAAVFHEAGVLALRVGRAREGVDYLHEALRRKGDHQPTHAALAEYYEKNGPRDRAEYHRRLAELP